MTSDRHQRILEALADKEIVSVNELSNLLNVTVVTMRTDLNELVKLGKVIRTHGGARLLEEKVRNEYSFDQRKSLNHSCKNKIGKAALNFVNSNDCILFDASTTVLSMAHELRKRFPDFKDITIIPTGIWTAIELMGYDGINVLLPGGYLRQITGSIIGFPHGDFFNSINIQKAFLGAWGISKDNGLTDTHLLEIELKKSIVKRAKEVTVLVDGSKFNQTGISAYAELNEITRVITDSTAPEAEIKSMKETGIEVVIAV